MKLNSEVRAGVARARKIVRKVVRSFVVMVFLKNFRNKEAAIVISQKEIFL